MAAAAAFAEVDQCLQWIGFTNVQHRNSIIAEGGFNSLNDFFNITETDICDMAKSFSKRSPAANRINFRNATHQVAYHHDALVPGPPTLLRGARHCRFRQRRRI